MKFKVGDKVTINKELWGDGFGYYGIYESNMLKLPPICTISMVMVEDYYLKEDDERYYWKEDSLISINESPISTAQKLFFE